MNDALLAAEPLVRIGFFLSILTGMATWERLAPRRRHEIPRLLRWGSNLGIVALNTLLVRLAFPLVVVGLAVLAEERGWGLLNTLELPLWASIALGVLALDLAVYPRHVARRAAALAASPDASCGSGI